MQQIAREVLAVSLHVADANNFDIEQTKKRLETLTQSVLKSTMYKRMQTVDLEFKQIDNLKDLLPQLSNCNNLKELILHGNRLNTLPEDLSILNTVETLDISNNLFDDIQPVVQSLRTMTRLQHLQINIRTNEEEQFIIDQLPNLLTLNGKRIRFHDLIESDRQSERSQTGSEINFEQEDLDNMENLYDNICNLEQPTLNKDSQLDSHVKKVMKEFQFKVNQVQTQHFMNTHILKAKYDLYELCFQQLIEYFRKNDNRLEKIIAQLQQEHGQLFNELSNIIYNLKDYKKISKETEQLQDYEKLKQKLTTIEFEHTQQVSQLQNQIKQLQNDVFQNIQQKNDLSQSIQTQDTIQNNDQDKRQIEILNQHLLELQKLQRSLNNEIAQKSDIIEQQKMQINDLQQNVNGQQLMIDNQNEQIQQFQLQIDQINFQNMQIQSNRFSEKSEHILQQVQSTQTLIKQLNQFTQTEYKDESNKLRLKLSIVENENYELQGQLKSIQIENESLMNMVVKNSKPSPDNSQVNLQSFSIQDKKSTKPASELNILINPSSIRPISMKQLRDLINEICESKVKQDQKAYDQPRETMEQHLHSFLTKKYGLKNLAIEWATAIIYALQKYAPFDADAMVFAKILQNEFDEDFKFHMEQFKVEFCQGFKKLLRIKYPLKHQADIKKLLDEKMNNSVEYDEALELVKLGVGDDYKDIFSKLQQAQQKQSPKKLDKNLSRSERLEKEKQLKSQYDFYLLLNLVLEYHIKQYEQKLRIFVTIFKKYDKDNDGVITQVFYNFYFSFFFFQQKSEFIEIMNNSLKPNDIEQVILEINPFGFDKITFSQSVKGLSKYENQYQLIDCIFLE